MAPTDTSEKGLESIIVASLVEQAGYVQGNPEDYDREHAVDLAQLRQFLAATHTRIPHPADFRCGHRQVDVHGIEVPELTGEALPLLDKGAGESDDVIDDEVSMDETD